MSLTQALASGGVAGLDGRIVIWAWGIIMGGVCLNDEGKGRIDRSKVVWVGRPVGSAGKLSEAARGTPGTWQNASVRPAPRAHPGNVGLIYWG